MYYHVLESLLADESLKYAKESDVDLIDQYLASLSHKQAGQISPWRVSQKTGVSKDAVLEILSKAAQRNLTQIKYELWHPETREKISEFSNFEDIKSPHVSDDFDIEFTDEDIRISFRLLDVRDLGEEKKKPFQSLSLKKNLNFRHTMSHSPI